MFWHEATHAEELQRTTGSEMMLRWRYWRYRRMRRSVRQLAELAGVERRFTVTVRKGER